MDGVPIIVDISCKDIVHKRRYAVEDYERCNIDYCAEKGDLESVIRLHNNGGYASDAAMSWAAEFGHLHVVKWLHENRSEGCSTWALDRAAFNGHYNVVVWLHENRTEGATINAMKGASSNGHLEIIKYLYNNKIGGNQSTLAYNGITEAARYGHFEIVKWFSETCPETCFSMAITWAKSNRHHEIAKYLLDYQSKNSKLI